MPILPETTVAAVTTPPGHGGIGVIEVHGPLARESMSRMFRPARSGRVPDKPLKLYYGVIHHGGRDIDDVLVRIVPLEQSFTGMESVEIHCHGGPAPVEAILNVLERLSILRVPWTDLIGLALRNGRIDRIQAEAHRAMPAAPTPLAALVLNDQARGALSRAVRELRTHEDVDRLLETAPLGCACTAPPRIVIAGRPNAGKSTLFNALLEYERALVHPEAGTTRDPVAATMAIEGIPFILVDTAGYHAPKDPLDAEGIRRTHEELARADLALMVFESGAGPDADDLAWIQSSGSVKRLSIFNKCDLAPSSESLAVSAHHGTGLPELRQAILDRLGLHPQYRSGAPAVFTSHQRDTLREFRENPDRISCRLL